MARLSSVPKGQPLPVCCALPPSPLLRTAALKERCYYSHFSDEEPGSERLSHLTKVTQLGGGQPRANPGQPSSKA